MFDAIVTQFVTRPGRVANQDRCILDVMTGDSYDSRTSEAEPEAFVLMESAAPPGEVEAVREVLRDVGLDLPVDASLARRSLGDLPWYLLLVAPLAKFGWTFAGKVAERLGERTGDALANSLSMLVRRLWQSRSGADGRMELEDSVTKTRIMLTEDLPDEAYDALRQIDLTQPELRGNVLLFDPATATWLPVL
jgi:hypothetical protein